MKKVFSNSSECIHIWAKQSQSEGRSSNVFFENEVIYSYGHHFPMAKILKDRKVLITNRSYSVTTAKHLSGVRYSVNHFERIFCYDPIGTIWDQLNDIKCTIQDCVNDLTNNRKRPETKEKAKSKILYTIENTNKLFAVFDTSIEKLKKEFKKQIKIVRFNEDSKILEFFNLWDFAQTFDFDELRKANEKISKETAKRDKAREKARAKELQESIDKWLKGDYRYNLNCEKVYLRIVENEFIQTSKGVIVPLREAKILFEMIRQGKDVKGHSIDGYTVISLNGILKIGCHEIERTEINRIASLLNWGQIELH